MDARLLERADTDALFADTSVAADGASEKLGDEIGCAVVRLSKAVFRLCPTLEVVMPRGGSKLESVEESSDSDVSVDKTLRSSDSNEDELR